MCGRAGIGGAVSSTYQLYVYGPAYVSSMTTSSDKGFKQNITKLTDAFSSVRKLQDVTYYFKKNEFPKFNFDERKQIGFIAQDLQKVFPELVTADEEGYLGVNYIALVPVLTEAIKEQQQQLDDKDAKLTTLPNQLNDLQHRLDAIEQSLKGGHLDVQPTPSVDRPSLEQNVPNPLSRNTI